MKSRDIIVVFKEDAGRSRRLPFLLVFTALTVFIWGSLSFAEDIRISADSMEQRGNVQILKGSVRIERNDFSIQAENAKYEEITGNAHAEGNVFYEDAELTIRASSAQLNLKDNTGMLYDGEIFFKEGGYRITGREIQRTAKDRYIIKRASATTCDSASPAWCFASRDTDILVGERLKARHATFRVKGLPLFYTPYFWAPIITERRTGFLTPTLGYQKATGLFYRQPFFWAITENRDATLFLDLFSKGSFGQGIEYRYIERPGFSGQLNAYHIRDVSVDRDYFETKFIHRHPGKLISGFIDINNVNYTDFYRRYEPYLETSATRYLESRAEVSVAAGNSRAYVLGQHYQDLKIDSDQRTVLQKLPEGGLFIAPIAFGPIAITGSGSAANFLREDGIDGSRIDGDIKAAFSIGRGPTLTQTIEAGKNYYLLNDTEEESNKDINIYDAPIEDVYSNEVINYTAVLQTSVSRGYGSVHHEVVPSIKYSNIARTGDDLPGSVFFDSTESIIEMSQAELALTTRLIDESGEFFTFGAAQPYDFRNQGEGGRSFLPLVLNMALARPISLTTGMVYDTYERQTNILNARASFNLPRTTVSVGHAYQRTSEGLPEIRIYSLDVSSRVTSSVTMGANATFDAEDSEPKEFKVDIEYLRQCWGIAVEYAERDVIVDEEEQRENWVFFKMSLRGVSSFGFSVRDAQSWSLGN